MLGIISGLTSVVVWLSKEKVIEKNSGKFLRGGGQKMFGGEGQYLMSSSFLRLSSFFRLGSFLRLSSFLRSSSF